MCAVDSSWPKKLPNNWVLGLVSGVNVDARITQAGKFVLQIGRAGQSKGNTDTANVNGAADVALYAKTNEIFVADGYGYDSPSNSSMSSIGALRFARQRLHGGSQ